MTMKALGGCFIRVFLYAMIFILSGCVKKGQIVLVSADFGSNYVSDNRTVPTRISLENKTTGAESYLWTFEGATPASSTARSPGSILYEKAGVYRIILEASNPDSHDKKEITIQIDSAVYIDFTATPVINNYAPVEVDIYNLTQGASSYSWIFKGGFPEASNLRNPGKIVYNEPGDYILSLTVFNGSKTFSKELKISVLPAIEVDFSLTPKLGDEDYEAPFLAKLQATGQGILNYKWQSKGADIKNPTSNTTDIYFAKPGEYNITLEVDNGKQTKMIEKKLLVRPNSNLYTFTGIKLGINTSHNSIGSFYSTRLQQSIKANEVSVTNGSLIDIAFFGLNSSFTQNTFVSPDRVGLFTFEDIPLSVSTRWINDPLAHGIQVGADIFDRMVDDSWLRQISFKDVPLTPVYFGKVPLPYYVLFQHSSGYKGIVRVREFHTGGVANSYILVDIKVQKN